MKDLFFMHVSGIHKHFQDKGKCLFLLLAVDPGHLKVRVYASLDVSRCFLRDNECLILNNSAFEIHRYSWFV